MSKPASAAVAPPRDTSSSGGKVFAKASKEWTIPPRPRPGRKAAETVPKTGKSAQNREAQRAFRERKQDYVAELEQRCRDYEQQEVQKNISLQTLSLALKADNERLKSDNDRLTQLVTQLGGDPTVTPGSTGSAASSRAGASAGRKRKKVKVEDGDDGSRTARETSIAASSRHGSRSGSVAGSSYSIGRDEGASNMSPTTVHDQRRASSSSYSPSTSTTTLAQPTLFHPSSGSQSTTPCSSSSPHTHIHRTGHSHPSAGHSHPSQPSLTAADGALSGPSYSPPAFDSCGFCTTNDTPCICRMAAESRDLHSGFSGLLNSSDVSPKQISPLNAPGSGPSSGVDYPASHVSSSAGGGAVSLPSAYLRRRNSGGGPRPPASIWSYSSAPSKLPSPPVLVAAASSGFDTNSAAASSAPANSLPECTGDPSACPACADDPFGKAFCETLEGAEDDGTETGEGSMTGTGGCGGEGGVKCVNCQETAVSKAAGGSVELSCCGAPEACGAGSGSGACVDVAGGDVGAKKLVLGGGLSHGSSARSASSFAGSEEPESHHAGMISTSTAWRQFKSHPNTTFADLSLLAEVVSRRVPASAGAHGAASPAASSPGPSSFAHASPAPSYASVKLEEEEHSMFGGGSVPPGSRKRRRAEVEVEGVREALRILDARGKRGPNGEIMLGVMGLGAVGIGSASVAPGVVEVAAGTRGRRMSDLRGTDRAEFGFDQLVEEGAVGGDVSMTAA